MKSFQLLYDSKEIPLLVLFLHIFKHKHWSQHTNQHQCRSVLRGEFTSRETDKADKAQCATTVPVQIQSINKYPHVYHSYQQMYICICHEYPVLKLCNLVFRDSCLTYCSSSVSNVAKSLVYSFQHYLCSFIHIIYGYSCHV